MTPFGSLVDPEVCTMTIGSAGVTASSVATSTSGLMEDADWRRPSNVQPVSMSLPGDPTKANTIRRNEGTISESSGGGSVRSSASIPAARLAT